MNQGFYYYFCMMIEGSGSWRPKNMWIRWIRIRNTVLYGTLLSKIFGCWSADASCEHDSHTGVPPSLHSLAAMV